ncbi:Hsp20/alpha crystallin family protein [Panacibacter ginsenosidivorans]|uniref:Hsp20/alpha crystallin family protein n=1 Tax=Panacibacter ginsenosidivorans TaxID=1813871 RepID=A0A5B8V4P1_9BACT|nr:Hsp20/alpha crystallin family protein [Panacibacter ginsenosidivorans]QEC65783.1 Hsp20/alpha crystallin family protein [Panacibacter ginsenosidivorans]
MTDNISFAKPCNVYPGEYIPMPEIELLLAELKITGKDAAKPPVNMDEFKDCFRIEMVIPGVKREDILVRIEENNILSVMVLHKEEKERNRKLKIHEFESDCLARKIILPGNVDTEFISAEYRQGILSFYIPKNGKRSGSAINQVFVY